MATDVCPLPKQSLLDYQREVMAKVQRYVDADVQGIDFMRIRLGKQYYLLRAKYCAELSSVTFFTAAPIWVDPGLKGLTQLNNRVYTVFDLRYLLNMGPISLQNNRDARLVFLHRTRYGLISFLVDSVEAVSTIPDAQTPGVAYAPCCKNRWLVKNKEYDEIDLATVMGLPIFKGL